MSGPPIAPELELAAKDESPFIPARFGELVDREGPPPPLEDECDEGWKDAFFFFEDDADEDDWLA